MRKTGIRRRSFLFRIFPAALALAAGTPAAFAHAKLIRSLPKDKARLPKSPEQIELWFDERLENEFNSVEIFAKESRSRRKKLASAKPKVDSKDRTRLVLKVESPLPPGEYLVEYRVLSRDSHTAPGRIEFTVLGS